jgi:L-fuconolactonase
MAATIDAHQHFWDLTLPFDFRWLDAPTLAPIRRNFLPDDLGPLIQQAGIERTVVVQTQHDARENHWALALAERNPFIAGVVGWVDLASPDCERQLLEVRDHPRFVGVRHVTQDEPDDFIVREDVLRGLGVLQKHGVPFDLLFFVKQLHHAATLAEQFPDLPMVIDHLAKPRIKDHSTEGWLDHLQAAARYQNVYCKLSGMVTEADWATWTATDLKPYVQTALDAFGPHRLMFGSDWPVCTLAGDYGRVLQALADALGPLGSNEQEMIFGGTAARFYNLAP